MLLANTRRREGVVAAVAAVCLVGILAVVALSLDGGSLLDKRRQAQATADAAAYAAASELFATVFTHGGLDNGPRPGKTGLAAGEMRAFAKKVAKENGFEDGKDGVAVVVNIPPLSGPFTGQPGHAEVIITAPQPRFFSTIFGSRDKVTIGARAVARGIRTTINNGIIVLHPTERGALSSGGGGTATVKDSAVLVNSINAEAMVANGNGSVSAPEFDVGGSPGWTTPGGGKFIGKINPDQEPTPDPLRFIPQPVESDLYVRSTRRINHSSASTLTLYPGVYIGGISVTGKGSVLLLADPARPNDPPVFYMKGGFSTGGQSSLTGIGFVIYNDPQSTSDKIDLTGGGSAGAGITLSPPMSGPWQGISLFQRRSGVHSDVQLSVTGNGSAPLNITGTFYAANALLKVTGNGTEDTIGSQYISNTLSLGGNGTFNVDWSPDLTPGIRQVWLVE